FLSGLGGSRLFLAYPGLRGLPPLPFTLLLSALRSRHERRSQNSADALRYGRNGCNNGQEEQQKGGVAIPPGPTMNWMMATTPTAIARLPPTKSIVRPSRRRSSPSPAPFTTSSASRCPR